MVYSHAMMRGVYVSIVATMLLCGVQHVHAEDLPATRAFSRELSIGSYGEDVRALQRILNKNEATRIRGSGAGSPGQETQYFGKLTHDAVIRFQEKYREEILTPFGLTSGTGRANWRTLAVAVRVRGSLLGSVKKEWSATGSMENTSASEKGVATVSGAGEQDPNREGRIIMLATVERIARQQGKTSKEVDRLKELVAENMATSTDLKQMFESIAKKTSLTKKSISLGGFPELFARVAGFLEDFLAPQPAYATGLIPFGGHLLAAMPCKCSATWLIALTPLPPTYVILLSYVAGTQLYFFHNIPKTSELLGFYFEPGICLVPATPCYPIPNQGFINPIVGSSLL